MIEAFPGVRVIYISCGEPDGPVVEDLGRKEFRFLTKPLEPEVVLKAIQSVLKPRSRRR
jgi:hypothetical protein